MSVLVLGSQGFTELWIFNIMSFRLKLVQNKTETIMNEIRFEYQTKPLVGLQTRVLRLDTFIFSTNKSVVFMID